MSPSVSVQFYKALTESVQYFLLSPMKTATAQGALKCSQTWRIAWMEKFSVLARTSQCWTTLSGSAFQNLVAVTATARLKLLNTTITYAWTTMAVSGWAQERATAVCLLPENALGKVLAACNAILSFVTALYFSIAASLVWYTNTLCI